MKAAVLIWRHNKNEIAKSFLPYLPREQVTENRWTGKEAIFQKTVAITEVFCETDATNIAHGITDFKAFVKYEGWFKDGSKWYPLPYHDISGGSVSLNVDATNITSMVDALPNFTSWSEGYVTLWYIKA